MKNLRKITFLCFACLLLLSSICMASDAVATSDDTAVTTSETTDEVRNYF